MWSRVRSVLMLVGVTLVIFWAFHTGYGSSRPHAEAQVLAVLWGGISALAWGLSVVGTLVWEDFGIVSSIKSNSWFNFSPLASQRPRSAIVRSELSAS